MRTNESKKIMQDKSLNGKDALKYFSGDFRHRFGDINLVTTDSNDPRHRKIFVAPDYKSSRDILNWIGKKYNFYFFILFCNLNYKNVKSVHSCFFSFL